MKVSNTVRKALTLQMASRAFRVFDRATMVVVGTCWMAALITLIFALLALNLASATKKEMVIAAAAEPSLPQIIKAPLTIDDMAPIVARLVKRFPDLHFSATPEGLLVAGKDVSKFRLWLTVLSYIDTISPQYLWTLQNFCVGMRCGGSGSEPMVATLSAQKISFATAEN